MSRDPNQLQVFVKADRLVAEIYLRTRTFPPEERFGLQSQLRRAAVSVPTNLVEGCARRSRAEYLRFIGIAIGSASEVRYLLRLSRTLAFISEDDHEALYPPYDDVVRMLERLRSSLEQA